MQIRIIKEMRAAFFAPFTPLFRLFAFRPLLGGFCLLAALLTLGGCGSRTSTEEIAASEAQSVTLPNAPSRYAAPGPPEDPWGPYISEASERFDVPEEWIRAVMRQESGGHLFNSEGRLLTSAPGAMGLMQLMPTAYEDLRRQYGLGQDPYNPRDNILAGAAYIRQMYEIYGSPGFLAAYNNGPGNIDRYLKAGQRIPRETRLYVASIGRQIAHIHPRSRSKADLLVERMTLAARRRKAVLTRARNVSSRKTSPAARAPRAIPQGPGRSPPPGMLRLAPRASARGLHAT